MKNAKQFGIIAVLLVLLIVSLAIKNKFKSIDKVALVKEAKFEQTLIEPSPMLAVSNTPAPQDYKKPKL
ncbi:MAG: hypothetical protein ACD_80C00213G0001, partial [uncultured bacterium (gcode 4)]